MAIELIGPDGREYVLDNDAELAAAVDQGFRVVTPDAPRTTGEQVEGLARDAVETLGTAVEGGVQGLTAGLYGAAVGRKRDEGESDLDYQRRRFEADEMVRRREENPGAYLAGDVAGMVVSPLGKLQGAVTKGLAATTALGRVGAHVAGGAAVGGLYGAGNTVSEAALGDTDLTAEKLFAGAGLGALLGGVGAGLGGTLAEAVTAIAPRVGSALAGSTAGTKLASWAENRALKAAGATKRDLDYLGKDKAAEVGQMLLERGHLGRGAQAPNAAGVLKSVNSELETVGQQLGKVFDDAQAAGAMPAYSKVLQRLDDLEAGLSPLQRKAISSEVQTARDAVLEYGSRPAGSPGAGFKALNELKKDLQAKAKWSAADPSQAFAGGLRRELAGVVREELDKQLLAHLTPDAGKAFLDAKKLYGLLADAERIAEHGVERLGGNASFGLRDLGMGAAAGLGQGNPVTGVVAAIASKTLRERGQGVIARLADSIAKSPRLSVAAQSFGGQLATAAPFLGRYAPMLQRAHQSSPALALATHMAWAQADPEYAEAAQLAGFLPETPEEEAAAFTRAGAIAGVASLLEHNNKELERGIDRVFKGNGTPRASSRVLASQDFGSKRMRRDAAEAHRQRMEEIRGLAANPEMLVDRVTANVGELGELAPGIAGALTRTAHTAVAFLTAEAQEPAKPGPLAADWVFPEADLHRFSQALETVQDPMSVLRHASAGTLTENQMRALNAVYPLLARQIADKALERLTESPKDVPYRARLMLQLLTGTDPDGTMGLAVAVNQATIQGASRKPSINGQPGGTTSSGKSPVSLAQRTATPSQKREMSEE